jgi:hypothetical protein
MFTGHYSVSLLTKRRDKGGLFYMHLYAVPLAIVLCTAIVISGLGGITVIKESVYV